MGSIGATDNWRYLISNYSENFLPLNRANNNKLIQMMSFCNCLLPFFCCCAASSVKSTIKTILSFILLLWHCHHQKAEHRSREKKYIVKVPWNLILKYLKKCYKFFREWKKMQRFDCCVAQSMRIFGKSEWRMFQFFATFMCFATSFFYCLRPPISDNT